MLNQTTVTALQSLLYMMHHPGAGPFSPAEVAAHLDTSPQYLSKIHTLLVKAGICTAQRGAKGGVLLARAPAQITLLEVVEACQGRILGNYCQPYDVVSKTCGFHAAMHDLHAATIDALSRWSLDDLQQRPQPAKALRETVHCRMACALPKKPGTKATG
jgi:Rrf2 family protein